MPMNEEMTKQGLPPIWRRSWPCRSGEVHSHADLAKFMAMMCIRNTMLEDIHAGLTPVTRTGDYSDVIVIDVVRRGG